MEKTITPTTKPKYLWKDNKNAYVLIYDMFVYLKRCKHTEFFFSETSPLGHVTSLLQLEAKRSIIFSFYEEYGVLSQITLVIQNATKRNGSYPDAKSVVLI